MDLVAGDLRETTVDDALARLETIADRTNATIQAFDARYLVGPTHLERALTLADRAIERDQAIADERAVEILLYAAGRRQIDDALEVGLKAEKHPVVVLVDGGDEAAAVEAVRDLLDAVRDPAAIEWGSDRIDTYFGITDAERRTGADRDALVLERVALLTVDR